MAKQMIFIAGDKVRECRQHLGMTQAILAKGICTQATISLIEKQNKMPNLSTLVNLSERLNVGVDELIVREFVYGEEMIVEAEKALRRYQYQEIIKLLLPIDVKKIANLELKRRYHFLLGTVALFYEHREQEAIIQFTRILATTRLHSSALPLVLAKLGLAIAFGRQGKFDKSSLCVEEALVSLENLHPVSVYYAGKETVILWFLTQAYVLLGEKKLAVTTAKTAIQRAIVSGQLFLLDEIHMAYAESLLLSGGIRNEERAVSERNMALRLARLFANNELVTRIVAKNGNSSVAN